jgi:6-phosphogluconolactonase
MRVVERFANLEALSRSAAEHIVRRAAEAVAERGSYSIALSGGSTPRRLYQLLASDYAARMPWEHTHVYWSDERCVPPTSEESCYRMARELLLDHISLRAEQVHRIEGEANPENAASRYEALLPQRLDTVLLGMGGDGHTASLFPGTSALLVTDRRVVANYVPKLSMWRITFTYLQINAAREALILVAGADKQPQVEMALSETTSPPLPVQGVNPADGDVVWMIAI